MKKKVDPDPEPHFDLWDLEGGGVRGGLNRENRKILVIFWTILDDLVEKFQKLVLKIKYGGSFEPLVRTPQSVRWDTARHRNES